MNSLSAEEEFSENLQEGRLAQLGERLVYTQEVGSSILSPPISGRANGGWSRESARWLVSSLCPVGFESAIFTRA
jgi:hypothetical protein